MFFRETGEGLFSEGGFKDFIWFMVAIVGMMTFAWREMPEWSEFIIFVVMLLSGLLYRLVTVEKSVIKKQSVLNKHNIVDFALSKNSIVVLILTFVLFLFFIINRLLGGVQPNHRFLLDIYRYCFLIIGTENLILLFHNKPIESYATGKKRDIVEDIEVGLKGWVNLIPTFINVGLSTLLFFFVGVEPSLYSSISYLIVSVTFFVCFKKRLYKT